METSLLGERGESVANYAGPLLHLRYIYVRPSVCLVKWQLVSNS